MSILIFFKRRLTLALYSDPIYSVQGYSLGHQAYCSFFHDGQPDLSVCLFGCRDLGKGADVHQHGAGCLVYFNQTVFTT